jgi:hypothetical protein
LVVLDKAISSPKIALMMDKAISSPKIALMMDKDAGWTLNGCFAPKWHYLCVWLLFGWADKEGPNF